MTSADIQYDDPHALAKHVMGASRPLLVGLDIDGVLAPITEHAHDVSLTPGILEVITDLAGLTPVAVISGRSIESIERHFAFPAPVHVVGSHGVERPGQRIVLTDDEHARMMELIELAQQAAAQVGDGAWVELKPLSAVLHVRQADPGRGTEGLAWFEHAASRVDGTSGKHGHAVYETMVRPTSKATAMAGLREEVGAGSALFVGDDVTDEEVFASLGDGDRSVRVGNGATAAQHRLQGPDDVLTFLAALRATWTPTDRT